MHLFKKKAKPIAQAGITPSTSPASPLSQRHGNRQTPANRAQPHLIFRLPEILEIVLSFLSTHTLKHRTSLVCRVWRELSLQSLSLSLPPVTAFWSTSFYASEQERIFRDNLVICRCLHLKYQWAPYGLRTHEEKEASWDKLQQAVVMQCLTNKSFRVTQLTVEGNLPMATRLEPLLANASLLAATLTAIRIEKFKAEQVLYIDQILNACENLIDLHLESPTLPKRYGILDPGFGGITSIGLREGSKLWMNRVKNALKIQRLTIKYLGISQQLMKTILPHCPFIKSLEIIYACNADLSFEGETSQALFELPPLYHLIVRCLPSLEHIHVSFISDVMRPNDAVVFRQVFDSVKSWSFAHEDLESSNLELILMPTKPEDPLHELTFPILTSLDIQNGSSATDLPEALHAYLVSPAAASLVHLKASYIPYWCGNFNPYLIQQHKLWTCRRLETLRLLIWHRSIHDPTWMTRVIFGYLTQLLPRMRKLWLHNIGMIYDLEGGFCLLKRMRYLEHVHIVSNSMARLEEKDLYWLIRRPTPTQKLKRRLWVARLRLQLNANQDPVPSDAQMQVDPVDGTVPRISSLGSLEDLIECLEDDNGSSGGGAHPDNLGNVGCLPCLESLVIERSGGIVPKRKDKAGITQMMKSLRPDCAFRIEGYF